MNYQPINRFALYDSDSSNVGDNAPHNIMPPFYVLTYIMKL